MDGRAKREKGFLRNWRGKGFARVRFFFWGCVKRKQVEDWKIDQKEALTGRKSMTREVWGRRLWLLRLSIHRIVKSVSSGGFKLLLILRLLLLLPLLLLNFPGVRRPSLLPMDCYDGTPRPHPKLCCHGAVSGTTVEGGRAGQGLLCSHSNI